MNSVFTKDFWLNEWENDKKNDTYNVHKGFSSLEYWDKASETYDTDKTELENRRIEKIVKFLGRAGLIHEDMNILEIGCGTGTLAMALADQGACITALDFSGGMLAKFRHSLPGRLENKITILQEDWHEVDIEKKGWIKNFDLVIAFMSPAAATPESFFKMMDCAVEGCAIRSWAAKRHHPVMSVLWKKIMGTQLEDKPKSILYKINLLFSMGFYPEITFDTIRWNQHISVQEEFDRQMAFFGKMDTGKSSEELGNIIRPHLESIAKNDVIVKHHEGLVATAAWKMKGTCGTGFDL